MEFNGLSIDSPTDVDWYRFRLATNAVAAARIDLASGSPIDGLRLEIFLASNLTTPIATSTTTGAASVVSMGGVLAGLDYLVKVTSPNIVPTTYSLRLNLTGTISPSALANMPKIDLALRSDMIRRDVILGNTGDDVLRGGAGEDWIFGNAGNDVLVGGQDRGASDLLFGGSGNDTFQVITDALPLLGNQPNTEFDPATQTTLTTLSDQFIGGDDTDRVLFLGGDKDRRGFDVPDFVALGYDSVLHRYEMTNLVWDIGTQAFRTVAGPNSTTIYEQNYAFYQTRDVESTEINLRSGNDVFHADAGFRILPVGVTSGDAFPAMASSSAISSSVQRWLHCASTAAQVTMSCLAEPWRTL